MESSEATQVTNVSPLLDLGVAAKAQAGASANGRRAFVVDSDLLEEPRGLCE